MNMNIEVTLTPEQIAQEFWELESDQHAQFFNHLAAIAEPWQWERQMIAIANDARLNRQAKELMRKIGERITQQ